MNPETKIILEAMDRKFEEVDKKLVQIDERFDTLEKRLEKKILDEIEALAIITSNGFDRMEVRFDKLERKVDNHETRITKLEKARIS